VYMMIEIRKKTYGIPLPYTVRAVLRIAVYCKISKTANLLKHHLRYKVEIVPSTQCRNPPSWICITVRRRLQLNLEFVDLASSKIK
jgi:hypothetical protein